jgi:ribosomal-protein-alanine N-acetyltransferase
MREFNPITTGGLCISRFRSELLTDRYVGWLNDPQVVRYSEQRHRRHCMESCGAYLAQMQHSDGLFLAMQVEGSDLGHIGNISVAFDQPNLSADLSIMIGEKRAWGRGYASLAWTAVMQYLLEDAGMRRVTAGTMEVNEPMIRLMQRSAMQLDCVRPRNFMWEGREVGLVSGSRFRLSK